MTSNPGAEKLRGPFQVVALRLYGRSNTQAPLTVACRERKLALGHQVLRGDPPAERSVRLDERQLPDLVRAHHPFGLGRLGNARVDDRPLARRHPRGHFASQIGKTQVAGRQQALHASMLVDDDECADAWRIV